MDLDNLIKNLNQRISHSKEHLINNLKSIRTGRANAAILDSVMVEAYGSQMPLKQVANVIVPEAQLIQITPFDPTNLEAIVTSIRSNSTLGLNPVDDGRVIRINIPPLTEDRRKELAKQVSQKQEEAMITIRNARHEANNSVDKAKKNKDISEDEANRLHNQIEDIITKAKKDVDEQINAKEKEILTL